MTAAEALLVDRRRRQTEKNARWAYFARLKLIDELGGKCAHCGRKKGLEIDHIKPRDWDVAKKSRWMRVVIYRREAKLGLLQVLCKRCNKKKGNR